MFWEKFIELCKTKNKSPNAVCAELGFSVATATKWKNGATPRDTTLKKISEYFRVETEYFRDEYSEKKPYLVVIADKYKIGKNFITINEGIFCESQYLEPDIDDREDYIYFEDNYDNESTVIDGIAEVFIGYLKKKTGAIHDQVENKIYSDITDKLKECEKIAKANPNIYFETVEQEDLDTELKKRPDVQQLTTSALEASPEDVKTAIAILETLKEITSKKTAPENTEAE